jgi:orotidine-5'-phosphate decarboxylase
MTFAERLHDRVLELNTRLCLGLDPRPEMHPSTNLPDLEETALAVERHCLEVLEACATLIACVKPQVAFYEALGLPGLQALGRICAAARMLGVPVILDAKRGDISSTAEAYARAWLGGEHAGSALTVNPYLGFDAVAPFLLHARQNDGAIFVLVKTSNPGSKDLQDLETAQGTISDVVAKHLRLEANGEYGAVGAVVGATHAAELREWRTKMPGVLFLLPGLGAQGAKAKDLAGAFDSKGLGAVVSASRGIQYASSGANYASAASEAARDFRDELNAAAD